MNLILNPYVINIRIDSKVIGCYHCTTNDPSIPHIEDTYVGAMYLALDEDKVELYTSNKKGMMLWFEEHVKAIKRETL